MQRTAPVAVSREGSGLFHVKHGSVGRGLSNRYLVSRAAALEDLHDQALQVAWRNTGNSTCLPEGAGTSDRELLPSLERQRREPIVLEAIRQGEPVHLGQPAGCRSLTREISGVLELDVCPFGGLSVHLDARRPEQRGRRDSRSPGQISDALARTNWSAAGLTRVSDLRLLDPPPCAQRDREPLPRARAAGPPGDAHHPTTVPIAPPAGTAAAARYPAGAAA